MSIHVASLVKYYKYDIIKTYVNKDMEVVFMSIVCIGQCAYDLTFPIHEPLIENQKYRIMEPFSCIGAPAANAAYLCALWKADTALISRCGRDFYGTEIRRVLERAGVDTRYLVTDEHFTTPLSAIIANSSNGYRTIFNCPGVQGKLNFEYPEDADILLLDGHELQASMEALRRFSDIDSVMDAGTYHEETKVLAQQVTYLVCSQDYARQYSNIEITVQNPDSWKQTFKALHTLNHRNIVVTLGDQGLLFEDAKGIHHMEAFPVSAVDTTGAGDIFHGAFTYCIHHGYTLQDALLLASATSAISVQTLGGQTSIPSKESVNQFLRKHECDVALR